MYCPHCGRPNDDNAYRCVSCRRVIQPVAPPNLGDQPGMRWLLPVGRSGWAIAAGYAGLFALLIFPAPLALILGLVAVWDIRRHPARHGLGRAWFAVIVGALGTALLVWMFYDITLTG